MDLAIISKMMPRRTHAAAINPTRIWGSMAINTPTTIKTTPGSINGKPEGLFSVIPMHVFVIGHIAIAPLGVFASDLIGSAACFMACWVTLKLLLA